MLYGARCVCVCACITLLGHTFRTLAIGCLWLLLVFFHVFSAVTAAAVVRTCVYVMAVCKCVGGQTEERAKMFLFNVSSRMKPGAHFLATFPNADVLVYVSAPLARSSSCLSHTCTHTHSLCVYW